MTPNRFEDMLKIHRFERNLAGRDFAVGDIHGCFTALQTALEAIEFNSAVDRLFCCGDLVDRGPESHLVEAWLDKPWFFSTMGNHELMAYQFALDERGAIANVEAFGGGWLRELSEVDLLRIGKRFRALPLFIEVETVAGQVGLVHADFPTDDWLHIENVISEDDRQICLWSTMRFNRVYQKQVSNVRALIHGHLTISTAQQIANVFFIDTGGWLTGQGHFTFIELETLSFLTGPGPNYFPSSRKNR